VQEKPVLVGRRGRRVDVGHVTDLRGVVHVARLRVVSGVEGSLAVGLEGKNTVAKNSSL
jgi:hypothetical protein